MAQILLHGNLHVTIYEVDKIGEGGGHGFFHKVFVLSFLCYGSMLLILITSFFFFFFLFFLFDRELIKFSNTDPTAFIFFLKGLHFGHRSLLSDHLWAGFFFF
jgi:hypothetical protein